MASDGTKFGQQSLQSGDSTSLSLLERVRANDEEAWRRLVDLYRPLVLYWCSRAGLNAEDAEDVAQGVFIAASGGFSGFRRDRPGDTFRGWLRSITRSQILVLFRREKDRPKAEGGSNAWQALQCVADPLPEDDDEAQISQVYRRALDQVRAEFETRTWQAFWMTVIEGHSPSSIAEALEMSPTAIRQAKSRVLRRLKEEMGELLD